MKYMHTPDQLDLLAIFLKRINKNWQSFVKNLPLEKIKTNICFLQQQHLNIS